MYIIKYIIVIKLSHKCNKISLCISSEMIKSYSFYYYNYILQNIYVYILYIYEIRFKIFIYVYM